MPPILDVAIGTVFIFLLFSLVVSALNEYLLSLTDQRAKFLRMGLVEIVGKSVVVHGGVGAAAGGGPGRLRSGFRSFAGFFPQSVRDIAWFPFWLLKSGFTLGGLIQWKDNPPIEVAGKNLLGYGLLNGYSRSENGTGTPSYIPPGAFVTALLDLIAGAAPAAALGTAQTKVLTDLIAGIQTARPAFGQRLTPAAYDAPLATFDAAFRDLNPPPAAGSLLADLHQRVATERSRPAVRDALLADTVADAAAARAIIYDPTHAAHKPALDLLLADAEAKANAAAHAAAVPPDPTAIAAAKDAETKAFTAFRKGVSDWFSPEKSFTDLQMAATTAVATLVATTAQLTANQILAGIDGLPGGHLKTSLLSLFEGAGRDVQKFKVAVEGWFNGVMDRVSGWYKRFAQKWMIALGFTLAAMFNVDTIAIVRELSNQPHLARAVASQAETYYGANGRPLTATDQRKQTDERLAAVATARIALDRLEHPTAATPAKTATARQTLATAQAAQKVLTDAGETDAAKLAAAQKNVDDATAEMKRLTDGGPATEAQLAAAREQFKAAQKEADTLATYQSAVAKLSESGLPVGWTVEQRKALGLAGWKFDPGASVKSLLDWQNWGKKLTGYRIWFSDHFSTLATLSAGWFLTAIAASLGAPFWFDLLGRFVNIRAAGRSPGEKDTTATPTRPAPASLDTTPGTHSPSR